MSGQNSSIKKDVNNKRVQGSWKNKITASELVEERKNCQIDKDELFKFMVGDDQTLILMKKVEEDIKHHPFIRNSHKYYEMTRQETQVMWMKKLKYIWDNLDRKLYFDHDPNLKFKWFYLFFGQPPIGLHLTMFSSSLKTFCDDFQRKQWLPQIQNFNIIGCYAQTEIGHGSDVASLQTTATYDKAQDEFIINTPNITATKWWPGDMGRFANYALVFARVKIPEDDGQVNDYGIAPFIVQIRCLDTHKHLKGIKTGDMGPKFGYQSKDNGWMTFDNVRIPRSQMPSRYMKIDQDGSFQMQGDPRILYSTMMQTRIQIFTASSQILYTASLIAIRYSIVRRQFRNISGQKEETKLLDYQTQQMKLFPILANIFAHSFASDYAINKYQLLLADIKKQDFSLLEYMHHLSSGLKAVQTQEAIDGVILIRQALGGAGYSAWSGIARLLDDCSAIVTYEGDNTVMAQQSFNYLLKLVKKVSLGKNVTKIDSNFQYLNDISSIQKLQCNAYKAEDFLNLEQISEALKVNLVNQLMKIYQKMQQNKQSKKDFINSIGALEIVKTSQNHLRYITFNIFRQKISDQSSFKCKQNQEILQNLCILYGLCQLNSDSIGCYESGYFKGNVQYSDIILDAIKQINLQIRPKALHIVEAYDYNDDILQSAIGNSYGDIYETHLEWAKDSKLNHTALGDAIPDGFMENIMPILKGKM